MIYLDFDDVDDGLIDRDRGLCSACPPKREKKSSGFHPFKKVGNFFSNLFKKKETYVMRDCCESSSPYLLSGICNSKPPLKFSSAPVNRTASFNEDDSLPIKKPTTSSNSSKQGYDDLILQQNITGGYWSKLDVTIPLFSTGKVKEVYEQVKKYIEVNGSNLSEEDKDRVISTFTVLYFIIAENPDKKVESKLIVNKAKKYLESKNMNYDTLLANIKVKEFF